MAVEFNWGKDDPVVPIPAKTTSDVYMVGGLAYELLTAGVAPFNWLSGDAQILIARRAVAGPVRVPGIPFPLPGMLGKSVLEAAEVDGESVPWCERAHWTPGSGGHLEELKVVVGECLAKEPGDRPKLPALLTVLRSLLGREEGEEVAVGWAPTTSHTGGGGGGAACPRRGRVGPLSVQSTSCPFAAASGGPAVDVMALVDALSVAGQSEALQDAVGTACGDAAEVSLTAVKGVLTGSRGRGRCRLCIVRQLVSECVCGVPPWLVLCVF
jgi:hypothetical protein